MRVGAVRCLSVFALGFAWLSLFDIHAAAEGERVLTPAQTRALLGDNLTMTYFDGSDYQTTQLTYATNTATKNPENDFGYANSDRNLFNTICPDGTRYLVYYATIPSIVPTVSYPTVQITPTIEFSGVSLAAMIGGFSANPDNESSQYNFVQYYVNGNQVINHVFRYHGSATTQANQYDAKLAFTISNTTRYFMCAPVYYRSDVERGYISDITFKQAGTVGTDLANGVRTIRFIISCPTISADAGSVGSTSGGGSVGGDLIDTNRKLDTIIQILNVIANNSGTPDTDPGNTDSQVESDSQDFDDQMDDINDQLDYLDTFDEGMDEIDFQEAQYTEMFDNVHDLIIDDPGDRELVPSNGSTPGTLPNSMQIIQNEVSGGSNLIKVMMTVTAAIALISFVIFGKWCT